MGFPKAGKHVLQFRFAPKPDRSLMNVAELREVSFLGGQRSSPPDMMSLRYPFGNVQQEELDWNLDSDGQRYGFRNPVEC